MSPDFAEVGDLDRRRSFEWLALQQADFGEIGLQLKRPCRSLATLSKCARLRRSRASRHRGL
jgi:hypothetical protein